MCWYISNDFLMSYMIETDVPVCVLICLDVYLGLQKQKLVTNKQKIANFAPSPQKILEIPFCCLNFLPNISNDFLMSYMIETDVAVCVLICLDVYVSSEDQGLVKNK